MIALTFLLNTLEISSIFKLPLSSTSAKIGFNPKFKTQLAEIIKDLGVTITSSPLFKLRDLSAIYRATLPFYTAMLYLFLWYSENSFSNF